MNFKQDLAFGNKYENTLIKLIPHDSFVKPSGYFKEYDIEFTTDNKTTKYEVKTDRMAYKTSNIAIEYECRNKQSGINTTTADYFSYFVVDAKDSNNYALFIIPVDIIKQRIKSRDYRGNISGGDYNASKIYLFNANVFLDYYRPELSTQTIDKIFLRPVIRIIEDDE